MRECSWCSKPFESTRSNKKYCSKECTKSANPSRSRTKPCAMCGKPCERRNDFCSRECSVESLRAKRAAVPPRVCTHCGATLEQKPNETWPDFVKRKRCGRECLYAEKRHSHDVFGTGLTTAELATLIDCTASVVSERRSRGLDLLTGERDEERAA